MLMLDCDGTVVRDKENELARAGEQRAMSQRPGMFRRLGVALTALFVPAPAPVMAKEPGTGKPD